MTPYIVIFLKPSETMYWRNENSPVTFRPAKAASTKTVGLSSTVFPRQVRAVLPEPRVQLHIVHKAIEFPWLWSLCFVFQVKTPAWLHLPFSVRTFWHHPRLATTPNKGTLHMRWKKMSLSVLSSIRVIGQSANLYTCIKVTASVYWEFICSCRCTIWTNSSKAKICF